MANLQDELVRLYWPKKDKQKPEFKSVLDLPPGRVSTLTQAEDSDLPPIGQIPPDLQDVSAQPLQQPPTKNLQKELEELYGAPEKPAEPKPALAGGLASELEDLYGVGAEGMLAPEGMRDERLTMVREYAENYLQRVNREMEEAEKELAVSYQLSAGAPGYQEKLARILETTPEGGEIRKWGLAKRLLSRTTYLTGEEVGAGGAVKRIFRDPVQAIPFAGGLAEMGEFLDVLLIARKEEIGERLSRAEKAVLDAYAANVVGNQNFERTTLGAGTEMALRMPAYAGEFLLTSPVFRFGAGAAGWVGKKIGVRWLGAALKGSLKRRLKRGAMRKILSGGVTLTGRGVAAIPGGMMQTPFMTGFYSEAIRRQLPAYSLSETLGGEELLRQIDMNAKAPYGEDFSTALTKSYGLMAVEVLAERTGFLVEKPLRRISAPLGNWLKRRFLHKWMLNKGITSGNMLREYLKRGASWNGIIGEVFEEEVGKPFKARIEGDPYEFSWEELKAEALGIAMFGGASSSIGYGLNRAGKVVKEFSAERQQREAEQMARFAELSQQLYDSGQMTIFDFTKPTDPRTAETVARVNQIPDFLLKVDAENRKSADLLREIQVERDHEEAQLARTLDRENAVTDEQRRQIEGDLEDAELAHQRRLEEARESITPPVVPLEIAEPEKRISEEPPTILETPIYNSQQREEMRFKARMDEVRKQIDGERLDQQMREQDEQETAYERLAKAKGYRVTEKRGARLLGPAELAAPTIAPIRALEAAEEPTGAQEPPSEVILAAAAEKARELSESEAKMKEAIEALRMAQDTAETEEERQTYEESIQKARENIAGIRNEQSEVAAVQVAETGSSETDLTVAPEIPGEELGRGTLKTPVSEYDIAWYLVDMKDVLSSHDPLTFQPTKGYPATETMDLQERQYHLDKEAQTDLINRSHPRVDPENPDDPGFNPYFVLLEALKPTSTAQHGAPMVAAYTVTREGKKETKLVALGGNARTMILKRLEVAGHGEEMRTALGDAIGKEITEPKMLVRVILNPPTSMKEASKLVSELNDNFTRERAEFEQARSAGQRVSQETLEWIGAQLAELGEDVSLRGLMDARAIELWRRLLDDGVVREDQRRKFFVEGTEGFNQDGKNFIERALLGAAVTKTEVLISAPTSALKKLSSSLAAIARIKARGDIWDVSDYITDALEHYSRAVRRGVDVEEYLNPSQMTLEEREPVHPISEGILRVLYKKKQADVRTSFTEYANDADLDVKAQTTMGFYEKPTPWESFESNFGVKVGAEEWGSVLAARPTPVEEKPEPALPEAEEGVAAPVEEAAPEEKGEKPKISQKRQKQIDKIRKELKGAQTRVVVDEQRLADIETRGVEAIKEIYFDQLAGMSEEEVEEEGGIEAIGEQGRILLEQDLANARQKVAFLTDQLTDLEPKPKKVKEKKAPTVEIPAPPAEELAEEVPVEEVEPLEKMPADEDLDKLELRDVPKNIKGNSAKLRKSADTLTKQIESKRSPAIAEQNPTPRRIRIITKMEKEADNLEILQSRLHGFADAIDSGDVPDSLAGITDKKQFEVFFYFGSLPDPEGYSQAEYKAMVKAGIDTEEKYQQAKTDLENLGKEEVGPPIAEREIKRVERELIGTKIPGYFPTPRAVTEKALELAKIEPGESVLEPSAGKGNMADVIREKHPDADLNTIEVNSRLLEVLELKEHAVIFEDDFIDFNPVEDDIEHSDGYDKIVMNPPFEKFQDVDHVKHAYEIALKPGGRLVAIMSEGPFFRTDKKAQEFRAWLDDVGGSNEKLPVGSFKSSERPTGVATRMVVINKPPELEMEEAPVETVEEAEAAMERAVVAPELEEEPGLEEVEPLIEVPVDKEKAEQEWMNLYQVQKDFISHARRADKKVKTSKAKGASQATIKKWEIRARDIHAQLDEIKRKADELFRVAFADVPEEPRMERPPIVEAPPKAESRIEAAEDFTEKVDAAESQFKGLSHKRQTIIAAGLDEQVARALLNRLEAKDEAQIDTGLLRALKQSMRPVAEPEPQRALLIGRGARGQVRVIFPDKVHADLYSLRGRLRKVLRGEKKEFSVVEEKARLATNLGVSKEVLQDIAFKYRDRIMELIKGVQEGDNFNAPRYDEGVTSADLEAPPSGPSILPSTIAESLRVMPTDDVQAGADALRKQVARTELLVETRNHLREQLAPFEQELAKRGIEPAEPASKETTYGQENALFTKDKAEEARARLRNKMGGLHAGIDPTVLVDLIEIGGYHFEAGMREFGAWSRQMIADFGENARPYLRVVWGRLKVVADERRNQKLSAVLSDAQRDAISGQADLFQNIEVLPGEARKEVSRGEAERKAIRAEGEQPRAVIDEAARLEPPPRPGEAPEREAEPAVSPGERVPGGVARGRGGRGARGAEPGGKRSLTNVPASRIEGPSRARGKAVRDIAEWSAALKRSGLPETIPPPTRRLTKELDDKLIYEGQPEIAEAMLSGLDQNDAFVLATSTGTGKCLAPGTPVMMYDGTIKDVEDVAVGNKLMGPDSKPRTVLSLARGYGKMYRITPTKGDPYEVNEPHILSLKMTNRTKQRWGRDGKIINISVGEFLRQSKNFQHCSKGYRVGVTFEEKQVSVDPYYLGLWLGDGTSIRPGITTADDYVVSYVYGYAKSLGLKVNKTDYKGRCPEYIITSGRVGGPKNRNKLRNSMKALRLFNNKHIPLSYKANSKTVRLAVLAGIVDSDGHLSSGGYEVIQKKKRLAEDIVYLARSLGFAAYAKPCKKTCTTNGFVGAYHRIFISGDVQMIPVRIKKKKARQRKQKKNVLSVGISVKDLGVGEYCGFEISGDGLFLLGDFTVTHNTYTTAAVLAEHRPQYALVMAPKQDLVTKWIDVLKDFGLDAKKFPDGQIVPAEPGVYVTTYATAIKRNKMMKQQGGRTIQEFPWEFFVADESQGAMHWYREGHKTGEVITELANISDKVVFSSATPFHNALEVGYMGRLGLWAKEGFDKWARQFGVRYLEDEKRWMVPFNPRKMAKLREQLIERGSYVNMDRDMRGYDVNVAMVPLSEEQRAEASNIAKAFHRAEQFFQMKSAESSGPRRGRYRALARSTRGHAVNFMKSYLERSRLPETIEIAKKLRKEGWSVILFSEQKTGLTEIYNFMKEADEWYQGEIANLLPALPDIPETLKGEFGDDVGNFSGSYSAKRQKELEGFQNGSKGFLYSTYAAGGIGIDMHDTSGSRPRAALYLGPPWSGIAFDQAIGRPWRFGTKSNVHAIYLTSDARPEMELLLKKVIPRMESLRASVSGLNKEDPVLKGIKDVDGALDYLFGGEHRPKSYDDFTTRVRHGAVVSYKEIPIKPAEEAKHKGMKVGIRKGKRPGPLLSVPPPAGERPEGGFALPEFLLGDMFTKSAKAKRRPYVSEEADRDIGDPRSLDWLEDTIREDFGLPAVSADQKPPEPPDEIFGRRHIPPPGQTQVPEKDLANPSWTLKLQDIFHERFEERFFGKGKEFRPPRWVLTKLANLETGIRIQFAYIHTAPYVLSQFEPTKDLVSLLTTTEMRMRREEASLKYKFEKEILGTLIHTKVGRMRIDELLRRSDNPETEMVGESSIWVDGKPFTAEELKAAQRVRDEIYEPIIQRVKEFKPKVGYQHKYSAIIADVSEALSEMYPDLEGKVPVDFVERLDSELREQIPDAKEPFSRHVLPRKGQPPKAFDILDVMDAYIPSMLRVIHFGGIAPKVSITLQELPRVKGGQESLLKEYAKSYTQIVYGVAGAYQRTQTARHTAARVVADAMYSAALELNPEWAAVNLSQILVNAYPELGKGGGKYIRMGAKQLFSMSDPSGRELVARSGVLNDLLWLMPDLKAQISHDPKKLLRITSGSTEAINRGVAYLGALYKARDLQLLGDPSDTDTITYEKLSELTTQGVDIEGGLDFAYGIAGRSQFMYTNAHVQQTIRNHPLTFMFKSFIVRQQEWLSTLRRLAKEAKEQYPQTEATRLQLAAEGKYEYIDAVDKWKRAVWIHMVLGAGAYLGQDFLRRIWPFDLWTLLSPLLMFAERTLAIVSASAAGKATSEWWEKYLVEAVRRFTPGAGYAIRKLRGAQGEAEMEEAPEMEGGGIGGLDMELPP